MIVKGITENGGVYDYLSRITENGRVLLASCSLLLLPTVCCLSRRTH